MVGCIYIFLQAEYVAIIQILIYAGAVTVLILFAVMLTKRVIIEKETAKKSKDEKISKIVLVAFLFYLMVVVLLQVPWADRQISSKPMIELGEKMFKEYILQFLVIALILFSAIVGGVILAREDEKRGEK
jgi:NADH-quinone oxidoreductase subunit J